MDMMSKAQLFAGGQLATEHYDIGDGQYIKIRCLNRHEAHQVAARRDDVESKEQAILEYGMVDPALTAVEVKAWMSSAPSNLIDGVVTAIGRLSGMVEEAAKSAYKSDGDGYID